MCDGFVLQAEHAYAPYSSAGAIGVFSESGVRIGGNTVFTHNSASFGGGEKTAEDTGIP